MNLNSKEWAETIKAADDCIRAQMQNLTPEDIAFLRQSVDRQIDEWLESHRNVRKS